MKIDAEKDSFVYWLLEHWRISSGEHAGERYSFDGYEYLYDIAADPFPNRVEIKCAQIGASELEIAEAFWYLDQHKGNVLYVLPAGPQLEDFVDARVRAAIFVNRYLLQKITGSLSLSRIQYQNAYLYFRAAQKRRQMLTVDVSYLFLDEVDAMDQQAAYTLTKRLGAASNPILRQFSTPTFPGTGITKLYQGDEDVANSGSDRRRWQVKCGHCNKWQVMNWEDSTHNFGSDTIPDVKLLCIKCKEDISPFIPNGQWVAEKPSLSKDLHGYHINKLMTQRVNLNQIWIDIQDPMKVQEVYNSDLGEAYQPRGSRVTENMLDGAVYNHKSQTFSHNPCVAGADVGEKTLHVRISQVAGDKIIGVYNDVVTWEQLDTMMDRFNIQLCIVDAQPNQTRAGQFKERWKHRTELAYYGKQLGKIVIKKSTHVSIDRTKAMSLVFENLLNGTDKLPRDIANIDGFYSQMQAPIKVIKEDAQGNIISWFPPTGKPDHYYHASVYLTMAHLLRPSKVRQIMHSLF